MRINNEGVGQKTGCRSLPRSNTIVLDMCASGLAALKPRAVKLTRNFKTFL